jgi:hypothetical protein
MEALLFAVIWIVVILIGAPLWLLTFAMREVSTTRQATKYWREKWQDDTVLENSTLLRAAYAEERADTLLHPAIGPSETAPQQLLRADFPMEGR